MELKLPDIAWSEWVLAGPYTIGDDKSEYDDEKPREIQVDCPYSLARYPITQAQFQCFLDAPDRDEGDWWEQIPDEERKFNDPSFPGANHPRETVSWYQAMAFCRWLTAKLWAGVLPAGPLTGDLRQYEITLPHEYEWEVAARWPNENVAERIYPWGSDFDATKANTNEGVRIGQTTAVGLYPSGKNEALNLYDLSGNVWEWCRNKFENPDDETIDQSRRVVRGGSWDLTQDYARAACRYVYHPVFRFSDVGFRVGVRRSPSQPAL